MSSSNPPKKRSLPPRKPSFPMGRVTKSLPPKKKVSEEIHIPKHDSFREFVEQPECVVCGGKIIEKIAFYEESSRHSQHTLGMNCDVCGIKYEFMPPKELMSKKRSGF